MSTNSEGRVLSRGEHPSAGRDRHRDLSSPPAPNRRQHPAPLVHRTEHQGSRPVSQKQADRAGQGADTCTEPQSTGHPSDDCERGDRIESSLRGLHQVITTGMHGSLADRNMRVLREENRFEPTAFEFPGNPTQIDPLSRCSNLHSKFHTFIPYLMSDTLQARSSSSRTRPKASIPAMVFGSSQT